MTILRQIGAHWTSWFKQYLEVGEAVTPEGRALLVERYNELRQQIPLIYATAIANFLGFYIATSEAFNGSFWPAHIIFVFMLVRFIYWMNEHDKDIEPEQIIKKLYVVQAVVLFVSVSFSVWGIIIFGQEDATAQNYMILYGELGAIGCAYGLSSFPNAARLPLMFMAMPLAARFMMTLEPAHVGIGGSLIIMTLLILRLVDVRATGFSALVRTRTEITMERARAVQAETRALSEQARVQVIAYSDYLTELPNRRAFIDGLAGLKAAKDKTQQSYAIALLDLDGFKPVNDTCGHAVGDDILKRVGMRLKNAIAADDVVARMGGDEFAVLFANCASQDNLMQRLKALRAAFDAPFLHEDRQFRMSACLGATMIDLQDFDPSLAIIRSDTALYEAKHRGPGEISLFSPTLEDARRRRAAIATELRMPHGLDKIEVVYQPIYELSNMRLASFEALARWTDHRLGVISPSEFVPIAEQTNMIEEISDKLLAEAFEQVRYWPEETRLSVNLSAVQLRSIICADHILALTAKHNIDPARIKFEVTETALLSDFDTARANLEKLKARGAHIVLDDFGAGFASIGYLRELHFDALKLDGSLIESITDSPESLRLLKGILNLSASLHTTCIAEHIETEAQLRLLSRLNCHSGQGFLLGRPLCAEDARALAVFTPQYRKKA